jgi:hypothetical protein
MRIDGSIALVTGANRGPGTAVLFFLRDRPTGALLFAGQVTDPA